MRLTRILSALALLTLPQALNATEQTEYQYTPIEQIVFAASTRRAFDHSGKMLTHIVHADGSASAEHNGSMGNVTVARLGPDGRIETFCTTEISVARDWMAGETGKRPVTRLNTPVMEK